MNELLRRNVVGDCRKSSPEYTLILGLNSMSVNYTFIDSTGLAGLAFDCGLRPAFQGVFPRKITEIFL